MSKADKYFIDFLKMYPNARTATMIVYSFVNKRDKTRIKGATYRIGYGLNEAIAEYKDDVQYCIGLRPEVIYHKENGVTNVIKTEY